MEKNLWPSFDDIPAIRTPKAILVEQGNYLEKSTQNILNAQITTSSTATPESKLSHRLRIVAPLLENYSITLLSIEHNVFVYPATLKHSVISKTYNINDEQTLLDSLKEIFNHPSTIDLISKLISQSRSQKSEDSY